MRETYILFRENSRSEMPSNVRIDEETRAERDFFFIFSYALKTLFGRGVFLKISRARALCSWTREGNETDEKREARSDDAQLFLVRARFWVFYEGSAGVFLPRFVLLSLFFLRKTDR